VRCLARVPLRSVRGRRVETGQVGSDRTTTTPTAGFPAGSWSSKRIVASALAGRRPTPTSGCFVLTGGRFWGQFVRAWSRSGTAGHGGRPRCGGPGSVAVCTIAATPASPT
jgi:hypothetical protein